MTHIVKNTLLNYLPYLIKLEKSVNPLRIFEYNNKPIKNNGPIIYLIERELRVKDNFALQFAIQKSKELNTNLKIIHKKITPKTVSKRNFLDRQILQTAKNFLALNFNFEIFKGSNIKLINYITSLQPGMLIIDFNPILKRDYLKNFDFKVMEIDGHNIIPAHFISNKQEYNAATLRKKIYNNISYFLTEYNNIIQFKTEADYILEDFIKNKLENYAQLKNNPDKNVLSNLSKYLNLGFISPQRVALEIIKSKATNENKEAFLEELIIRQELADNYCLYSQDFKSLKNIPLWAKKSLINHKNDLRIYNYTRTDFENAKTHDKLWNATQNQLKTKGTIHGYLRMYWAKKILEWSKTPNDALKTAIFLNDKYAFDAPSANGYVGILWAIGGLHDRAFQDWFVTGKIRRMTFNSISKKIDIKNYIKTYS